MLNKLMPESWEYVVRCKKEQGKKLFIKSVGTFSNPHRAMTFMSRNGRDWVFYGNFEVHDKKETIRSAFLEMWFRTAKERGA